MPTKSINDILKQMENSTIGIELFCIMRSILEIDDPKEIQVKMKEISPKVNDFIKNHDNLQIKDPKTKDQWMERSLYWQSLYYVSKINEHLMERVLKKIKKEFIIPVSFQRIL